MKKLPINNCWECPMIEPAFADITDSMCGLDDKTRTIKDPSVIPEWCPLDDM